MVRDVSLEVRSGEVVGLLGPNGAGKTTCFYMIVGLVPSDAGVIELDARPIGRLPIHRRARIGLSYLPQEASVFRKMSVEENIRAVLELQPAAQGGPLPATEIASRLDDLRIPPGNRLEALRGDRAGQHSIRINDQYRLCFRWSDSGPEDVELVDYH